MRTNARDLDNFPYEYIGSSSHHQIPNVHVECGELSAGEYIVYVEKVPLMDGVDMAGTVKTYGSEYTTMNVVSDNTDFPFLEYVLKSKLFHTRGDDRRESRMKGLWEIPNMDIEDPGVKCLYYENRR